ncbi:MAG TPA: cytochrome d ubiquinol oxidase subunit II [Gaiellaceae bacterium]|nr:cytochrome d ubiquinol oxidase subunit II [Gaiellaceae bacterium]
MQLYDLPLAFALIGLALYAVLGGADFGAGFWQLLSGKGKRGDEIRAHARHAMAPVWEANHVWLIFVLTVIWTGFPLAFGSIASTLAVPFFLAGIGIVLRGGAYAMREAAAGARWQRTLDTVFSISSILTPFALGTMIGAIASGRVRVGNPGGTLWTSWLNATSIEVGVLAVATAAYTAAVFLSGDAERHGDHALAERFRLRALGAGIAAGAVATVGLVVLHSDAERLFHRITQGPGLPALVASLLAGVATLALVWARRYEPARYTAALAVAATIVGWALAQNPVFLPGLTVRQAAAPHDTQLVLTIAVAAGAVLLFPSLALLFRLTLGGQLGHGELRGEVAQVPGADWHPGGTERRLAGAFLIGGAGFLTAASTGWAHAIGVACLFGFVICGYRMALPENLTDDAD